MRLVKTKGKDIQIPETWYDISFEKFLVLRAFEKTADDYEDANEYNLKHLCLMLNLTEEEYFECQFEVEQLKDILVTIYSFCRKELPILDEIKIKIGDKTFEFDKETNLMSVGRFIDKENNLKEVEDFWEVGHKIASSFLREVETNPIKKLRNSLNKKSNIKKYTFSDAAENAELFKTQLPIPYINSIVVFFLVGVNNFAHTMKSYSQQLKTK